MSRQELLCVHAFIRELEACRPEKTSPEDIVPE